MTTMTRWCVALGFILLAATAAPAQPLPFDGPIRIVSGFPPGGSSDVLARLVADKMQASLGRAVIIETKTGAGGRIAAEFMKTVPADGSTILLANTAMMVLMPLVEKVGYDPVKDFAPIARTGDYQIVLGTGPMTGAKDYAGLVAWLEANPDKANYGVPAPGSLPHLFGLQVAKAAGVPMVVVPFRGGAPIANALIGSQLAVGLSATADFVEQHRAGTMRIVAASGNRRLPALRDVPTFADLGLAGFEENGWNGFFAPAGVPPAVIAAYNKAIVAALTSPDVAAKLEGFGFLVTTSTPDALGAQIVAEQAKWKPLLAEAGVMK